MTVTIHLTRLSHAEGLPLPASETEGSAGMDLRAAVAEDAPVTLQPGGRALIPTGLTIALPEQHEAQVRPRSGLALKFGVTCLNSPGTIDADYRGEVGVILANLGSEPFTVRRGDRRLRSSRRGRAGPARLVHSAQSDGGGGGPARLRPQRSCVRRRQR